MAWDKIKSLFVVTEGSSAAALSPEELAAKMDAELARFQVPADAPAALPVDVNPASLAGTIDFQALYDQAGIPNTDEVEALEKFLSGLDSSLPSGAQLAAAKAFLNAIGKSANHVLEDAARKIQVVRGIDVAKRDAVAATRSEHEAAIRDLEKQIDEHKQAIAAAIAEHDTVKHQCAVEEARLQGARAFFGHMDALGAAKPTP